MEDIEVVLIDDEKSNDLKKSRTKSKKKVKKKKKKKIVITFIVLDVLALLGYFITYGPWDYARNLLVTTSFTIGFKCTR